MATQLNFFFLQFSNPIQPNIKFNSTQLLQFGFKIQVGRVISFF